MEEKGQHKDENILLRLKPAEWLKTLATTLDVQSTTHTPTEISRCLDTSSARIGPLDPALGVSNPCWVVRTQARRFQPTLGCSTRRCLAQSRVGCFDLALARFVHAWSSYASRRLEAGGNRNMACTNRTVLEFVGVSVCWQASRGAPVTAHWHSSLAGRVWLGCWGLPHFFCGAPGILWPFLSSLNLHQWKTRERNGILARMGIGGPVTPIVCDEV